MLQTDIERVNDMEQTTKTTGEMPGDAVALLGGLSPDEFAAVIGSAKALYMMGDCGHKTVSPTNPQHMFLLAVFIATSITELRTTNNGKAVRGSLDGWVTGEDRLECIRLTAVTTCAPEGAE